MRKLFKYLPLLLLPVAILFSTDAFAQSKDKKELTKKRDAARHALRKRDSLMRSLNRTDTSINSKLQRIEQYITTFNQIKNNLADGLDTTDISEGLPPVMRRLDKIGTVVNTRKLGTLRYLAILRDNLDRMENDLDGWQSDLQDINTKLVQNQTDLNKFAKDTLLKAEPTDSLLKNALFVQKKTIWRLWHKVDSANRKTLLKVNLLQDQTSIAYTKTLDETDQIDSKIKDFAMKAIAGESSYIWSPDAKYNNFQGPVKSTVRLDTLLFNFFIKNETIIHLLGFAFFIVVFSIIIYNRSRALKNKDTAAEICKEADYVCRWPILSPLLVATSITPYFYNHPPTIFLEIFFLISVILSLIIIKRDIPKTAYSFLMLLFVLAIFYALSNLLIEISNIDRYFIFLLGIVAIYGGITFYKKVKKSPGDHLPNTTLVLSIFIGLEILSVVLNVTGRFSLAKIIGVTAVFNLWLLITFYLVINIIIQAVFLHFQHKKGSNSIINWFDYNLVQKKFRGTLLLITSLLWLFSMLQNLNLDDWAKDNIGDLLNQSQAIGSASFTFGGFVIFVLVIWLSSIVSKIISYFYDVSAQRTTDLSIQKRKNRTSVLVIRMAVFTIGFLLAVAASNFPLDKLTIIISAFGVGIGFGLQNIVNNLVSGLILAFEKPINIGDIIQVDGHMGTMKEIGIRSSRVVTGDGSEVIIPNGDLISHQVTNWTLSNSNRQIELRVITAYGVDINKTKDLFKSLLSNRNDIMTSPAPSVFVNNISESAVEFKILFWEPDISTTASLKSQILSEIYQAIDKEGVQLPSTQKDIFVHFPEGVPLANPEKNADKKSKD